MKFDLPRNLPPGSYELKATVGFGDAAVEQDSFVLDVLGAPAPVQVSGGGGAGCKERVISSQGLCVS